ncbi:chorismate mutase [Erwinia oleae]|uniref:chorismate mutase n=1 Tax=Erwinia oleae TaxID=796334 RepID=UPI0005511DE1|nr:chorismate mutase [Erwinia oleae]
MTNNQQVLRGRTLKGMAILLAVVSFTASANMQGYKDIAQLINQRLGWMKDVAGYKAKNHQPVEDLTQEDKVLTSTVKKAEELGLDAESVRPFIQAQMDAAKAIQYRYRADWLFTPEKNWKPQDLETVRKEISRLSDDILDKTAETLKQGDTSDDCSFMHTVQQHNLHKADKDAICQSLRKVKLK